jgi:hypothetical protein
MVVQKKKKREVMFLTAFKMAGINCSEMNFMLRVGVPRAIKPWEHPGFHRKAIISLLNDGTFQHWKNHLTCCSHITVKESALPRYNVYKARLTWLLNRAVSFSSKVSSLILFL